MTKALTLDDWLSLIYTDDIKGRRATTLERFKIALENDPALLATANIKFTELQAMITERGERACFYSTKYWNYLKEVVAV